MLMYFVSNILSIISSFSRFSVISFEKEPMPIFFLLYAKKKGILDTLDLNETSYKFFNLEEFKEDQLLTELYQKFTSVIAIENRRILTYNDLIKNLNQLSNSDFLDHYGEIIASLLSNLSLYSGRISGEICQPDTVSQFIAKLVHSLHPKKVFNPFAGLASYAFIRDLEFYYGQEINNITYLLAKIRLEAHGKDVNSIYCEDSLKYWEKSESSDFLISTPPFDIKFNTIDRFLHGYNSIEEFILLNFLKSTSLKKAVIIVPKGFCFVQRFFAIKKTLIEKNALDMVIELPAGIFYASSLSTVVLVLDKNKNHREITFVDGQKCLIQDHQKKHFDYKQLLHIIEAREKEYVANVYIEDLFTRDLSLLPTDYTDVDLVEDGQESVPLGKILELGVSIPVESESGIVITPSNFSDDVNMIFNSVTSNIAEITLNHKAYRGEHLVFSFLQNKIKICKCSFDAPFHLNLNQVAFRVKNSSPIEIDYLIYALLKSTTFSKISSRTNGTLQYVTRQLVQHILNCQIVIHKDRNIQEHIISDLKEKYIRSKEIEHQAEMQRLGIRTASSDLSHMLGTTFDKISNSLYYLKNYELADEVKETLASLNDNFDYMKRFITSVGADFSTVKVNCKEVSINSFLQSYTKSWENFGTKAFEIQYESHLMDDTSFKIDDNLFRVLFDTILNNAYRHGFEKINSSENLVKITSTCTLMDDKEYILLTIANNGNPFPENFSLQNYISRGVFSGNSGRTGLGGNHVYSIVKLHEGFLNITNSAAWNVIIELLIPVEFYNEAEKNNFEPYGNIEQFV